MARGENVLPGRNHSMLHRLFDFVIMAYEKVLKSISTNLYFTVTTEFIRSLDLVYEVDTKFGPIKFNCDSSTTLGRAKNSTKREPDTINWVESFSAGDIMWDIGCNIGVFSIFAAKANDVKVYAFDAMATNIAGLVKNIQLNGLGEQIIPFCAPLMDKSGFANLYVPLQATETGGNGAQIKLKEDAYLRPIDPVVTVTSPGYALDDLVQVLGLPVPTHIKMDVDGVEEFVIAGAMKTLANPKVKSLMFEIPPQLHDKLINVLDGLGFKHEKSVSAVYGSPIIKGYSGTNNFFTRR